MTRRKQPNSYVSIADIGECKVCGERKDRRYGTCFGCSEYVVVEMVSAVTRKLWDVRNPSNHWYFSENRN